MKALSIFVAVFTAFTVLASSPASHADGVVRVYLPDFEKATELVEFYRKEPNQKALLSKLTSASDKVYFQKLFAELKTTRDRVYSNGPVATFFTKSHGVFQVTTIKFPSLFLVNGQMLSIPKDKASGVFSAGAEILKVLGSSKVGKKAALRSALVPEAHAFSNSVPSNVLFLHLSKPILRGPVEGNSDSRDSNPRRIPDELVETFAGKAGGVMTCSSLEAKVEGGALAKHGFRIRKIFAQDAIEISSKDKVIQLSVPKISTEKGLQFIHAKCMETWLKDGGDDAQAKATAKCDKDLAGLRQQNPTFVDADALGRLDKAQVCDKTGRVCTSMGPKDLDAIKRDADGFSLQSLVPSWFSEPSPLSEDERKKVSKLLIASAQVLAMAEPLCKNPSWWNAAAWAFEIRRDSTGKADTNSGRP